MSGRSRYWVKLARRWHTDEAVMRAGIHAELLFVRGLGLADDDGYVSDTQLPLASLGLQRPTQLARKLCEVGLWERNGAGYRITGWEQWQPKVLERETQSASGKRGAHMRWHREVVAGCTWCERDGPSPVA